jgi:large subunit ribosomal protein L11
MADKKIKAQVKMLIKAGSATPAPPVGSTLGPLGINLVQFCKEFNDKTSTMQGMIPILMTVFEDRSYEFILKTPPVAELIKQILNIPSGAANPIKDTVGTITEAQIIEIAKKKLVDLNGTTVESGINQVKGTCKSMGVKITA